MRTVGPRSLARRSRAVVAALLLASTTGVAHHAISAKFDDKKPQTLTGVVTLVDWRNPHVHVFMNVKDAKGSCSTGRSSSRARSICSRAAGTRTRCSPATRSPSQGILRAQRQPSGVGQLDRR